MKKFWFVFLFFATAKALAYPEMIRHHYVNCSSCHFSPSGGGLLNAYGRTISYDVLSTWGGEKEARPFYGALDNEKLNQWLQVGGDARGLQFHHESPSVREGRFIPMQENIELAVSLQKWTLAAAIGKTDKDWNFRPVGTRYWMMYQFMDELTLRVGRFIPVFGVNIPQHNVVTRGNIGFNEGMERDSAELMWSGEKWNFAATASQSVRQTSSDEIEQAMALQVNYTFADSYRVGGSYWLGTTDSQHRQMFAVHSALGFSERFYALSELDYQIKTPFSGAVQKGIYHFGKVGYEWFKGFHWQFVEEYSKSNLDAASSETSSLGAGFLFYPRPHFEFEALFAKKRFLIVSSDPEDYGYLMVHYYF